MAVFAVQPSSRSHGEIRRTKDFQNHGGPSTRDSARRIGLLGNTMEKLDGMTGEAEPLTGRKYVAKSCCVDFWASWCGPLSPPKSRNEKLNLESLRGRVHDRGESTWMLPIEAIANLHSIGGNSNWVNNPWR